jgi:hypothetical protein
LTIIKFDERNKCLEGNKKAQLQTNLKSESLQAKLAICSPLCRVLLNHPSKWIPPL